jgi:hypothetical protein
MIRIWLISMKTTCRLGFWLVYTFNGADPTRLLPGLAGVDLIFQWIGMMEYIPCYSALELHRGLLPATRLASRKILI